MKKFVYIMTSAPIHRVFDGYDIYDAYDRVAQGLAVAPLVPDASRVLVRHAFPFSAESVGMIFTAEKGQTLATAQQLVETGRTPHVQISATPLFTSVRFSMRQLISREHFFSLPYKKAIVEARKNFVQKFYDDQLLESRQSVMARMHRVCALVDASTTPTLCISHSFFMRLLQIAIRDPSCFHTREKLLRAFCPEKKPFEPLTGFRLL